MNIRNKKMKKIMKILFALCYFGCCLVLIVEAALPGSISSNQSNTIGGGIADIINNGAGDQSVLVKPTGLKLTKPEVNSLFVGDTLTLKTTIEPENCSYNSVSFQSDNDDVLSVDENGTILAKKEGKANIKAYSTSFPDISDTLTFSVCDIIETSIESRLLNANKNEDGYYVLEANHSYPIETVFTPDNVTDKSIKYSLFSEGMTETDLANLVTVDGNTLYAKKKTDENKPIEVKATSKNGLTSSFSVLIEENQEEVIPLESISVSSKTTPAYSLAVKESIAFTSKYNISFSPSNATYKQYRLESSDSSIIKVSGTSIVGVKEGECDISVYSTYYDLSSSIRVSVKKRPLESIQISLNYQSEARIKKGGSSYIRYSSASPSNSDPILQKLYDYESSNSDIIVVDSSGKVTAKEKGSATVTMNFYQNKEEMSNHIVSLSKSLLITVFEPSKINSITYTNTLDETYDNSHVLYSGKEYNLSSYIKVDKMYDAGGNEIDSTKEGISKELTYKVTSLSSSTEDTMNVTLVGNKLSTMENKTCGMVTIEYSHSESGLSETVQYTILNEMNPIIESEYSYDTIQTSSGKKEFNGKEYDTISTKLDFYVTSSATIRFEDNQSYSFKTSSNASSYLSVTSTSSTSISFRGIDEGDVTLLITPIYDGREILGASKVMDISVHHKLATSFTIHLFENDTEIDLSDKTDDDGKSSLSVYVDSTIELETVYAPFETPTNYRLSVTTKENNIAHFSNFEFKFSKVGKATFQIKEEVSGYTKEVTFYVINRVKLNEETPISIKQSKVSYDKETNTYHIENGTSARIITNFDQSSTFKSVKYDSSNEEILTVGDDGMITPLKAGSCDIRCLINDNNSINYKLTVHIVVDKKKLITNMTTFLYMIRKGLGHFGAFLITAVFSVLFYLFIFDDKRNWIFSIPFIFLQGLFVAELTEFIQLFTPNRYGAWSDVMIDFTGFSIGASFTLLVILVYYLIRYFMKKKKEKKKE